MIEEAAAVDEGALLRDAAVAAVPSLRTERGGAGAGAACCGEPARLPAEEADEEEDDDDDAAEPSSLTVTSVSDESTARRKKAPRRPARCGASPALGVEAGALPKKRLSASMHDSGNTHTVRWLLT
jgi:hypothetical protein